jgi:hypothetical protein
MRKQWFGDSRDYVKWSCIRHEAQGDYLVLYGVMLGKDSFKDKALDPHVVDFFDRRKDFSALGELFPKGFVCETALYTKLGADEYFDKIIERISELQAQHNILVFLDPDTGMEPKGDITDKHLRMCDVRRVCAALMPGDKLVIYQHASRVGNWIDTYEMRLKHVCGDMKVTLGPPFYAPGVAKDVCFFTLTKIQI